VSMLLCRDTSIILKIETPRAAADVRKPERSETAAMLALVLGLLRSVSSWRRDVIMLIPDLLRLFGRLRDHGWYSRRVLRSHGMHRGLPPLNEALSIARCLTAAYGSPPEGGLRPHRGTRTMSRLIAMVFGLAVAGCTSMPSLPTLFNAGPATQTLRIESEPQGAEARTAGGQNCLTPCEVVVPAGAETVVSFALRGYQPLAIAVHSEAGAGGSRLQPNPVYAELNPILSASPAKKGPVKRKKTNATTARQPAAGAVQPPSSPQ